MNSIRVRRLGDHEWPRYREIRLRALTQDPDAFSTTAAEAVRWTDSDWAARLRGRTTFVAEAGEHDVVGLVSGIEAEPSSATVASPAAELISMWVPPGWRGRGIGDQLVDAVAGWAWSEGYTRLRLWVVEGNDRAERLYRRVGFHRTGEQQPLGRGGRSEFAMERQLRGGAAPAR